MNKVESYPECLVLIKHIPSGTLMLKKNLQSNIVTIINNIIPLSNRITATTRMYYFQCYKHHLCLHLFTKSY